MNNETIQTPETEVLEYLKQITGTKFRPIKSNLSLISALFKAGYTQEEIIEVIQLKTVQWKNNPVMAPYLRPSTLFNMRNFDNYINELELVKQNPKMYAQHFAELNKIKGYTSAANDDDDLDAMYGKRQ
ncbi:conserved phage C-terminal domain-containing protein [Chryseobacterium sp. TY4]